MSQAINRRAILKSAAGLTIAGAALATAEPVAASHCNIVVPDDEPTIQDAVDAASDGDTICVKDGTYTGSITIDKSVKLTSAAGASPTIDASGSGENNTLVIGADSVTIQGFEIIAASKAAIAAAGGFSPTDLEIKQNTIRGSTHGINNLNRAEAHIVGNTVTKDSNHGSGNGMHEIGSGSIIKNNVVEYYSNGPVIQGSNVEVKQNVFKNLGESDENVGSYDFGVDVAASGTDVSNVTIIDNVFQNIHGNKGEGGVGLVTIERDGYTLSGVKVENNNFEDNDIQVQDFAEALDISAIVTQNSFDQAVVVDRPGSSLLHTVWSNIQDALADAESGDTIEASDGTYPESLTIATPDVTLKGAGRNETLIKGSGSKTITLQSTDITLRGITITNTTDGGNGIDVPSTVDASGFRLKNAAIKDTDIGFFNDRAETGPPFDDIRFQNVEITDSDRKGIYTEALSNAVLENLTIEGVTSTTYGFNAAIDLNLKYGDYENITIREVVLTDVAEGNPIHPKFPVGLTIKARQDGPYASPPATLSNITVEKLSVTDTPNGIRFGEVGKTDFGLKDATVNQSTIEDNDRSGLLNETDIVVDATQNYWGAANGPSSYGSGTITSPCGTEADGDGDAVSDGVCFAPWIGFPEPINAFRRDIGPPQDLDGDGRFEDVNGNGRADRRDPAALSQILTSHMRAVRKGLEPGESDGFDQRLTQAQQEVLDFNEDGTFDRRDVTALSRALARR